MLSKRYHDTISKLMSFQGTSRLQKSQTERFEMMDHLLKKVNIKQIDLTNLKIIHIAGTKGKGSTCAFVESILRHYNFKTGMFTSPHLVEIRERFKIDGKPISKKKFIDCFEDIEKKIESEENGPSNQKPPFFYLLTLMAFQLFIQERIDVAIVEVGIGGAYDCTNVVRSPMVCGISMLEMDHTPVLGNSIESIAWHKSGILKDGVLGFTLPQEETALRVIFDRAKQRNASVYVAPDFSAYTTNKRIKLGLDGDHQYTNASLALQLSQCIIDKEYESKLKGKLGQTAPPFELTNRHIAGLELCSLNGRCQTMRFKGLTFYLDSAHTSQSMRSTAKWFNQRAQEEADDLNKPCVRILAFNITKKRDPAPMFKELISCGIDHIIFMPNESGTVHHDNKAYPVQIQLEQIGDIHKVWLDSNQNDCGIEDTQPIIFPTIATAITCLSKDRDSTLFHSASKSSNIRPIENRLSNLSKHHLQILVTGNGHIAGGFLQILDPNMDDM